MALNTTKSPSSTTRKITLTLPGNDLKPPVYIAGSFTKEPWLAEEMDVQRNDSTEGDNNSETKTVFTKMFDIPPGEYHYKFRLGDGDWWICDESSKIVRDEVGNSNNLLIVEPLVGEDKSNPENTQSIHPPSSEDNTTSSLPTTSPPVHGDSNETLPDQEEESPLMRHESFVGTWEPDQEISPNHRRASTSLGIQISRIGTFLPPEPTEEDLKNSELEAFPRGRKNILARMEMLKRELPEDEGAELDEALEEDGWSPIEMSNSAPARSSKSDVDSTSPNVSNLDSILEVNPDSSGPTPALLTSGTTYSKLSGPDRSYGTIPSNENSSLGNKQSKTQTTTTTDVKKATTRQQSSPTATTPLKDSEATPRPSESSLDSGAEQDKKEHKSEDDEEPKGILFFAVIAGWFKSFWSWFFTSSGPVAGAQENYQEDTNNTRN